MTYRVSEICGRGQWRSLFPVFSGNTNCKKMTDKNEDAVFELI